MNSLRTLFALALVARAHGYISSIEPRYGSLGGGTIITIHGDGLIANDTLAIDMYTGQLRCDPQWYRSTSTRLYCQTQQLHADAGAAYQLIYSNWMTATLTTCKDCTFSFDAEHTPYVNDWSQTAVSRGIFSLGGVLKAKFAEQYTVMFDGGLRCTGLMRQNAPKLGFGLDLYEQVVAKTREEDLDLQCYLPILEAGRHNFTVQVKHYTESVIQSPGDTHTLPFRDHDEGLGRALLSEKHAWSIADTWNHGYDLVRAVGSEVYSVHVVPQIASISTQRSGLLGRQTMVIRGSGFSPASDARGCTGNVIKLAGVECAVTSCTHNELHCIVGRAAGAGAETAAPFTSTTGLRRVTYDSATSPPDVPAGPFRSDSTFAQGLVSSVYTVQNAIGYRVRSEHLLGFFVAPASAWYSFYVASADACELKVGKTNTISGDTVSATCSRDPRYDYFSHAQHGTEQVYLLAGHRHAFSLKHWNPRNSGTVKTAVRMHDPPVPKTREELQYHSVRERQRVNVNIVTQPEIVDLSFDNVHPSSFIKFQRAIWGYDDVYNYTSLEYDSVRIHRLRESAPIGLNDANGTEELLAALKSNYANPINCQSMSVVRTGGDAYGWVKFRITTNCLPRANTNRNAIGNYLDATNLVSNYTGGAAAPEEDESSGDESGSGTGDESGSGDDETPAPSTSEPTPAPTGSPTTPDMAARVNTITTVQLPTVRSSGSIAVTFDGIDRIVLELRRLHTTDYVKNKFQLFNNVMRVEVNTQSDYRRTSYGFEIEFIAPQGFDYPLMQIDDSNARPYPSENRGSITVVAEALVDGNMADLFYDPIPDYMFELDTADVPNAVITVNDVVAECSTGRDFVDRAWDTYGVPYGEGDATKVLLAGVNDNTAMGLQACIGECDSDSQCAGQLECFQRENGEPIPGCSGDGAGQTWDYCYDPAKYVQAPYYHRVPGNDCSFQYLDDVTPEIFDSTSGQAGNVVTAGDEIVITGRRFLQNGGFPEVQVRIGGALCNVTDLNDTQITCVVSDMKGGLYHPDVITADAGHARIVEGANPLNYATRVDSIAPLGGSVRGGNVLAVHGTGFSTIGPENQVMVGGHDGGACAVISASHTTVTCYAPFAPLANIDQLCWGGEDCGTNETDSTTTVAAGTVHTISWGISSGASASITINVGDTVIWTWDMDSLYHNVIGRARGSAGANVFESTIMNAGSFSYTFTSNGSFPYHCGPHAQMNNVIVVEESRRQRRDVARSYAEDVTVRVFGYDGVVALDGVADDGAWGAWGGANQIFEGVVTDGDFVTEVADGSWGAWGSEVSEVLRDTKYYGYSCKRCSDQIVVEHGRWGTMVDGEYQRDLASSLNRDGAWGAWSDGAWAGWNGDSALTEEWSDWHNGTWGGWITSPTQYEFDWDLTPSITRIEPSEISSARTTAIAITGNFAGFSLQAGECTATMRFVSPSGLFRECQNLAFSVSGVTCTLVRGKSFPRDEQQKMLPWLQLCHPSGLEVVAHPEPDCCSAPPFYGRVDLALRVDSVSPSSGSLAGGSLVTIHGAGFGPVDGKIVRSALTYNYFDAMTVVNISTDHKILSCDILCDGCSADFSTIVCETPMLEADENDVHRLEFFGRYIYNGATGRNGRIAVSVNDIPATGCAKDPDAWSAPAADMSDGAWGAWDYSVEDAPAIGASCEAVSTDGGVGVWDYRYTYRNGTVDLSAGVVFSVQARRDAHVVLSPINVEVGSQRGVEMYEIVLGGWENSMSSIARTKFGTLRRSVSSDLLLRAYSGTDFWVQLDDATIKVGAGCTVGHGAFMEWTDPEPIPSVQYFGVATADTPGAWVSCLDRADMPLGTCGTEAPPLPTTVSTTPFYNLTYTDSEAVFQCEFDYNEDSTPLLSSVAPTTVTGEALITVTGTGFTLEPVVTIGPYECAVQSWTTTQFTCMVPEMTAGHYHMRVRVPGSGLAAHPADHASEFTVTSGLTFTSVTPRTGSVEGGLTVTITGSGFSYENADNTVTVGGSPAHILNSTFEQLVIVVPAAANASDVDDDATIVIAVDTEKAPRDFAYGQTQPTAHRYTEGTVDTQGILESEMAGYFRSVNTVQEDNASDTTYLPGVYYASSGFCSDEAACSFTYMDSETPTATDVTPTSGQIHTRITITGTQFGTDASAVDVLIGNEACVNITVTSTSLECDVGAVPAGTHEIYLTNHAVGTALATGVTFTATLTVQGISVDHGSYGGGHVITISGTGFGGGAAAATARRDRRDGAWGGWVIYDYGDVTDSQSTLGSSITLCDQDCVVQESSYDRVVCSTPSMSSPASILAFGAGDASVLSGTIISSGTEGSTVYGAAFDGDYETSFMAGLVAEGGPPAHATYCASEGESCACAGTVWYGVGGAWVSQESAGTISCSNSVFGDPRSGIGKQCQCVADATVSDLDRCHTGLDLGAAGRAIVSKIRFFPAHQRTALMVSGELQISDDGITWSTIHTISGGIHEGWNSVDFEGLSTTRHVRYLSPNHKCAVAFLEFSGVEASAAGVCPVRVETQRTLSHPSRGVVTTDYEVVHAETSAVEYTYSVAETPVVTAISPRYGSSLGNTVLTVTGTGLPAIVTDAEVMINGRACDVVSAASDGTQVTCRTTPRTDFRPLSVAVKDTTGVGTSVNNDTVYFRYLDRWSQANTWLNDERPLENDTVVIPPDQAIVIDVPLPRLFLVLIQGFVMFDPAATVPLNLNATYIIVYGGALQVGTHDEPFEGDAAITLHGDRWDTVEIPNFGSKVLAVADRGGLSESSFANGEGHEVPQSQRGVIDIHGKPRVKTWTQLSTTAYADDKFITLSTPVDFMPGEKLVITGKIIEENEGDTNDLMADMPPPCMIERAFQQHSRTSAEEVEVLSVVDSHTIMLVEPLKHTHESELVTTPAGKVIDMRAQVGLLTRNVVIQGDDSSPGQMFGAHTIAVHGGNLRVENTEVRNCGQARNLGRYCLHFHKAGFQPGGPDLDWKGSYLIGNSIHDSFQRATTIHGTTHAVVTDNVAYRVHGHNYFVEDGDEEYVRLERNLAVETMISPFSLFSDCQAASFWTATPKNFWRDNVAANSHGHGFWYELDAGAAGDFTHHPTLEVSGNIYHDNNLRGWFIAPTYTPDEPQYFRNNTYYRNSLDGVFYGVGGDTHHVGDTFVSNSGTADMMWWFFPSRESSRWIPNLKDVTFMGGKWGVSGIPTNDGGAALFAPNMEFFLVDGAEFYNYGDMAVINQCFDCCGYRSRQGAFTTRFAGLSFPGTNVRTKYACPSKQIYFDMDGTLSGQAGGTVTAYHRFNEWEECPRDITGTFGHGIVCNSSVRVRKLSIPAIEGMKRTEPREVLGKDFYIKKSRSIQPFGFRATFLYVGGLTPTAFEKRKARVDIAEYLGLEVRHVVEDTTIASVSNDGETQYLNVVIGGFLDEPSQLDAAKRRKAVAARDFLCGAGERIEEHTNFVPCAAPGGTCACPSGYVRYGYGYHWGFSNNTAWINGAVCESATFGSPELASPQAAEFTECQCLGRASCMSSGIWHMPLNMAGQGRTVGTPAQCRQRCRDTPGCNYFNSFRDGGCHITTGAEGTQVVSNNPTVQTGSTTCRLSAEDDAFTPEVVRYSFNFTGLATVFGTTPVHCSAAGELPHECSLELNTVPAVPSGPIIGGDNVGTIDFDSFTGRPPINSNPTACFFQSASTTAPWTVPLDGVPGESYTYEKSPLGCQMRCADTAGCAFFAFWTHNGVCRLTNGLAEFTALAHPLDSAAAWTGNRIVMGPAYCYNASLHAPPAGFYSMGAGTGCAAIDEYSSTGWPIVYMHEEECQYYKQTHQVYDPIDYGAWTKSRTSEVVPAPGFSIMCAHWECSTPSFEAPEGCAEWSCLEAAPGSAGSDSFSGTWFIGVDPVRDAECRVQTCHDRIMAVDSSGQPTIAGCRRYRCTQAMLDTCESNFPIVTTEAACLAECASVAGCTSARFTPRLAGTSSCRLYDIPHSMLTGAYDGGGYSCKAYMPDLEESRAECQITTLPSSENTCLGKVRKVDEFGGVHYQQNANTGELFTNKIGLDNIEFGPGLLRTEGSPPGFDWEGWAIPLVTHHDYILDIEWHIDFQQFAARWSEPYLLQNPMPPADAIAASPPDCRFSGATDFMPLTDGSVLLTFPYIDYRYRYRVDVPRFPNMPWYDKLSDDCTGNECSVRAENYGLTRGEITRHDDFGQSFIDREDDSLATTGTQGSLSIAINPWSGVDVACDARPQPLNTSFSVKALQCSPYMCDSGIQLPIGVAMPWSEAQTWQAMSFETMRTGGAHKTGFKPGPWAIVEIPAGFNVVVDENPPIMTKLVVYGRLTVSDDVDVEINTESIVNYGEFIIGTPAQPHEHHAEIVIHGNRTSSTVVVSDQHFLGNKVIANFGNMSFHARTPSVIHEKLAVTAEAGATSITMLGPVDWQVNDTIVLAGTGYMPPSYSGNTGTYTGYRFVVLPGPDEYTTQTEELVITDVSEDGLTVSFDTPLAYRHFSGAIDVGLNQESFTVTIDGAHRQLTPRGVSQGAVGWDAMLNVNGTAFAVLNSASACTEVAVGSPTAFAGRIALIERSLGCDLPTHVRTALLSGAIAVAIIEQDDATVLLRDYEVAAPTIVLNEADGTALLAGLGASAVVELHAYGTPVVLRASAGNIRRGIVFRGEMTRGCTEAQHSANLDHYQQHCAENGDTFYECNTDFPYPHECYFMKGYGAHFFTGEINYGSEDDYLEALAGRRLHSRTVKGQIVADGVEFRDFGKLSMEHRGFLINYFHEYTAEELTNAVDRCVFRNSWYDALVIGEAPKMSITQNIVHRTLGLGINLNDGLPTVNWNSRRPQGFVRRLRRSMSQTQSDTALTVGEAGSVVEDNLVTAAFHYPSALVDTFSHYDWHSGMLLRRPMERMQRNIVSGCWGGMSFQLQDAHDFAGSHTVVDNEAYANYYGIIARGHFEEPRELYRAKAWSNAEAGFVAFDEYQDLQIREVSLADNKYGASVSFKGSAKFEVRQSQVIGNSAVSNGACPASVGITLPVYTPFANPSPRCGSLFGDCKASSVSGNMLTSRFGNTYTGRSEKFYVESTAFAYFGTDACGDSRGIHHNPTSPDYAPDVFLTRLRWHSSVAANRRFTLGDHWGTHEGCHIGGFHLPGGSEGSCDALSYLRVIDTDGSTTGNFWSDGRDDNHRNTVLYSDRNPALFNEANCRAHSPTRSIICQNYPLTLLAIDVPPLTPDGGADKSSVSHVVIHKYHPGNGAGHSNTGDAAYNRTYWTVGAFEQGTSCQKHFMGGSSLIEPGVTYDIDMPVENAINADGDAMYWQNPGTASTPEMHPMFVPPNTRFTYYSNDPNECFVGRLWMQHAKPVTIFFNGNHDMDHLKLIDGSLPTVTSPGGTSVLIPQERRMHMTICGHDSGEASYVMRVEERVQVTVAIDMDYSEFFAEEIPDMENTPLLEDRITLYQRTFGLDRMVNNFALLLDIPMDSIRVACVHAVGEPCIPLELMLATGGYNPTGGRNRRAGENTAIEMEIVAPNPLNETGDQSLYDENSAFYDAVTDLLMNATNDDDFQEDLAVLVQATFGENVTLSRVGGLSVVVSYGGDAGGEGISIDIPLPAIGLYSTTASPTPSPTNTAVSSGASGDDTTGIIVGVSVAIIVVIGAIIVFIMYSRMMRERQRPLSSEPMTGPKVEMHAPQDVTLGIPALAHLALTEDDPAIAETEFTSAASPPSYLEALPRVTPSRGAAVAVRDSLIDLDELPEFSVLNGAARQASEDFVPRRTSVPMLTPQPSWAQDLPDPATRKSSVTVLEDVISPSTTGTGSKIQVAGVQDPPTRRGSARLHLADGDDDASAPDADPTFKFKKRSSFV
jgi:plastocyanin